MNHLVDEIERLLQTRVHRLYNDEEGTGVSRLVAEIALAEKLLSWTPQVTLREGLAKILERDSRFSNATLRQAE